MSRVIWEGAPRPPRSLRHHAGVAFWISLPLYLLGLMVLLIARANWDEVEGAGMVWLLAFFTAGPLAIAVALFPGTGILARRRYVGMRYAVTDDGAQINGRVWSIGTDTPIRRTLAGGRSRVTFRDGKRVIGPYNVRTGLRARRTIPAVGFRYLTEDEARAAEAALLLLKDRHD